MMRVLRGLWLLGRFRPEGFAQFGEQPQDLLNSLAPLLAFPAVFAVVATLGGRGGEALPQLLTVVIALLGPLVLSHALAERWRRLPAWPRYAVAFNWCQWLTPAVMIVVTVVLSVLLTAGVPEATVATLVVLALLGYAGSLQWFLARRGLGLGRLRALGFVLLTNGVTAGLIVGPQFLRAAMDGGAS